VTTLSFIGGFLGGFLGRISRAVFVWVGEGAWAFYETLYGHLRPLHPPFTNKNRCLLRDKEGFLPLEKKP
jgi:hypothetical protein